MGRTQLLAVLVVAVVAVALVGARLTRDSGEPVASAAATPTPSSTSAGDDPADEPAPAERAEDTETDGTAEDTTTAETAEPERLGPAPDLVELDGWLQTEATSLDDFDGQVKVVQFWTFGCYNCKNTLPHLQALYETYHPLGVEIIGVHAPEFDFEKDPAAIASAAQDLGVVWPIAIDTDKTNFRAWQPGRRFWPRVFVIDQAGEVRFDHIGEGAYDELEATVAYLVEHGA